MADTMKELREKVVRFFADEPAAIATTVELVAPLEGYGVFVRGRLGEAVFFGSYMTIGGATRAAERAAERLAR